MNGHGDRGVTPLYAAAVAGQREFVQFLLDHGADPKIRAMGGKTALNAAAERGDRAWSNCWPAGGWIWTCSL